MWLLISLSHYTIFCIHLDKSLAYSIFKVQKLNARKIFQKHKTDSQFTYLERKHVVACRSKEQMKNLSQILNIYVLQLFLERTKMYRMYSKIAMLNIFKISLSLKMSNVYISNDRIMMSIPNYYSVCGLKILLSFVL